MRFFSVFLHTHTNVYCMKWILFTILCDKLYKKEQKKNNKKKSHAKDKISSNIYIRKIETRNIRSQGYKNISMN